MEGIILKWRKQLIGIMIIVLAIVIVMCVYKPKKAEVIDVFKELKSQSEVVSRIKSYTVNAKEHENDIATVHFQDELFADEDAMILLCGSHDEAEVFKYYFNEISNNEKMIHDKLEYGNYFQDVYRIKGGISYVYKVDNCLLY